MSRITRISWGRTYNTGNFTSYRVDLEYALSDTDEPYDTMVVMARRLHVMASKVLAELGVRYIHEPGGVVDLMSENVEDSVGDADDLPY